MADLRSENSRHSLDKSEKALEHLRASLTALSSQRISEKKRPTLNVSNEEPSYVIKEITSKKMINVDINLGKPPQGMLIRLSGVSKGLFSEKSKDNQDSKTQLGRIVSNSQKRTPQKKPDSIASLAFKAKKPAELSLEDSLIKDQTMKSSKSKVKQKMLQLSEEKPWMFRMDKWKEPNSTTPKHTSAMNLMKTGLAHKSKLTLSPKATSGFLLTTNSRDEVMMKPTEDDTVRQSLPDDINQQTLYLLKVKEQLNEVIVNLCRSTERSLKEKKGT